MKHRQLIASAFLTLTALSAHAGTVIFHTGDSSRPTAGVDFWNYTSTGSVVQMTAFHNEFPYQPTGPSAPINWQARVSVDVLHKKNSTYSVWPFTPAQGSDHVTAVSSGDVFWWFEYVPSNPGDTPTWALPCYADVQRRGTAFLDQSTVLGLGATSVAITGEVHGDGTDMVGNTLNTTVGPLHNHYQTVTTGNLAEIPIEFYFSYDPVLGKWLGKPTVGGGANGTFDSWITIAGGNSKGDHQMEFIRDFKVLRVRTPAAQTFPFNTPW